MRTLIWLVLVVLCGMSGVHAATVDEGLAAFRAGDYAAARDTWLPLSDAGDARATYLMSLLYAQGKGVAENPAMAMEFLAAAARDGHAVAQFNLGNHYNQGKWVKEDPAMAAYWWRLAGAQEMARAQHNLASLYVIGRGVSKDLEKARHWYARAARNGSQPSADMLGQLEQFAQQTESGQTESGGESQTPGRRDPEILFAAPGHAWIRGQAADRYTLQLFASGSPDAVQRLLARHQFNREVAVFRFDSGGKILYAVSYGSFPSAASAKAAVAELPETLQRGGPWARRFGDIQALIR